MKPKKGAVEKVRPFAGDIEIAREIAEKTGLARIDVMSLALSAGLKAIRANHYRMPLPLGFRVENPDASAAARREAGTLEYPDIHEVAERVRVEEKPQKRKAS